MLNSDLSRDNFKKLYRETRQNQVKQAERLNGGYLKIAYWIFSIAFTCEHINNSAIENSVLGNTL